MARTEAVTHVRIGRQGRLVIPAEIRRRLGFEPGQELAVRVEEGRLVLETPDNVLARLRGRFRGVPAGTSLADELVADRRREVELEGRDQEPRRPGPDGPR